MRRAGVGSTPMCYNFANKVTIMEPQVQEPAVEKHPVHQVTPVSKYLAMALFIILPFVGGWIGYTYAPEKVVEVEIERQAAPVVVQSESVIATSTESVLIEDENQSKYDRLCSEDNKGECEQSNPDFYLRSESMSGDEWSYTLRTSDKGKIIYAYNTEKKEYEPLVSLDAVSSDLLPLSIVKLFEYFEKIPVEKYIHLTSSYHEGLQYAPLLRVAVGANEPIVEDTGFMTPNHPGFALNPSMGKIVVFPKDKKHQMYLYDVKTGNSKLIHEINPETYTYFNETGYGEPAYRVKWQDNDTVILWALSLEKNKLSSDSSFVLYEDQVVDELRKSDDLIEAVINTSGLLD